MLPTEIKQRLCDPKPLHYNQIINFHTSLKSNHDAFNFPFDKSHTLPNLINRLHRAIFGEEKFCDISSTGAIRFIDKETQETLFIAKKDYLPENLGVPSSEATAREQLYYLLDYEGFAGVPPTLRVEMMGSRVLSFQWFKMDTKWWDERRIPERKASLRRCAIHQFRTANMDPSRPNIIIPRNDSGVAFPVDGGYCLPYTIKTNRQPYDTVDDVPLADKPYFDEPFTEEEKSYIRKIDIDKDQELIKTHLQDGFRIHDVLRIFRGANLMLKHAIDSSSITLHDICSMINVYSAIQPNSNESLFECIVNGKDDGLNDHAIEKRICEVFKEVASIKTKIYAHGREDAEQFTIDMLNTIDKNKPALRKVTAIYILGKNRFYASTNSQLKI
jgi:hypothetical protein